MTSKQPISWQNPDVTLYHGTLDIFEDSIIQGIDLSISDQSSDFGRGFYTTTNLYQARVFAAHKFRRWTGNNQVSPTVLEFVLDRDEIASLETLSFVRSDIDADDFWNIVESCRTRASTNRLRGTWYDLVIGPVSESYHRKRAWDNYDQYSFHTMRAVTILHNSYQRIVPWP